MAKANNMETSYSYNPHRGESTRAFFTFKNVRFEVVSFRRPDDFMPSLGIEIYILAPDGLAEFLRYAQAGHTELDDIAIYSMGVARANAARPDIAERFAMLEID